jgi:lysophospholipase L1-like esterase
MTAALLVLGFMAWMLVQRPQWIDALVWRFELLESSPRLSQRIFERQMLSHQLAQDRLVLPGATLLFGDSHLQALPPSAFSKGHNFSVGGESAARLSIRLPRFQSVQEAAAIVLAGGTNDLLEGRGVPDVLNAWERSLDAIPAKVRVVCVGIPEPLSSNPRAPLVAEANIGVKALCSSRGHSFVDVQPRQAGAWSQVDFLPDGVHLDHDGQRLLAGKINEAITGVAP